MVVGRMIVGMGVFWGVDGLRLARLGGGGGMMMRMDRAWREEEMKVCGQNVRTRLLCICAVRGQLGGDAALGFRAGKDAAPPRQAS